MHTFLTAGKKPTKPSAHEISSTNKYILFGITYRVIPKFQSEAKKKKKKRMGYMAGSNYEKVILKRDTGLYIQNT